VRGYVYRTKKQSERFFGREDLFGLLSRKERDVEHSHHAHYVTVQSMTFAYRYSPVNDFRVSSTKKVTHPWTRWQRHTRQCSAIHRVCVWLSTSGMGREKRFVGCMAADLHMYVFSFADEKEFVWTGTRAELLS
jgi:hypothetical protein